MDRDGEASATRRGRRRPSAAGPGAARVRAAAAGVMLLLAAACVGGADSETAEPDASTAAPSSSAGTAEPSRPDPPSFAVEQVTVSPEEAGPRALVVGDGLESRAELRHEDPGFGPAQVAQDELRSGGPPPDGIPSIDSPRFHRVAEVEFLDEQEPVFALELGGEARAYPLQVMTWHEIVNDTVGGIPVAVTYCPLCNSAFAHDRRHEGRVLSFGVSGLLYNSSLVMFDRQSFSLWSHFTGQGLLGVFAGDQLGGFPVTLASWAEFKAAHPDGLVLSRDTGFNRRYGVNPYPGYDDVNEPPFLFEGAYDGRLAAKVRVVGLDLASGPQAVTLDRLRADGVVALSDGGDPLVVWRQPGARSALDALTVAEGKEVGTTGAFRARLDGQTLTFTPVDGGFADQQTASTWDVFGRAVAGPLAGRRLEAIEHVDTFWFAWAAFQPDTGVTS